AAEQLDVEDVRLRLLRFHAAVKEAVERHGGVVEKFIGDAVFALFGAEEAHEDDAVRAVRAALDARDAVARLRDEEPWLDLHVRLGAATGEALVAVGAPRDTAEGIVAGDVLNTAARIQAAAPVDGVLVGAETYHAARAAIEFREAAAIPAKGKADPVPAWEAVAPLAPSARPGRSSPLVGRAAELARLGAVWNDVLATGRAALAAVVGPAGSGKSRLVAELLAATGARVLRGRCLAYGEGITYWPLAEALADVSPAGDTDDGAAIARSLAAVVREEAITKGELHWGIRRLLELEASAAPTVLVVEDVHWAEPTLLDLLASLDGLDAPLLVVTTSRDDGAAGPGATVVALEPLSETDSLELLGRLLGDTVSPSIRRALAHRAGGNPLFLEETVRSLASEGAVADPADLPLP